MANEARARPQFVPAGTLSAAYDPATDTTIESTIFQHARWPAITAAYHVAIALNRDRAQSGEPFLLYGTAHTYGNDTVTVDKDPHGTGDVEGTTPVAVPSGTLVEVAITPRDSVIANLPLGRTAGNVTLTTAGWINVDTALDQVIVAYPGDLVGSYISGTWLHNQTTTRGHLSVKFNASGTHFHGVSEAVAVGQPAWYGPVAPMNQHPPISGGIVERVVAADVDAGARTVTLRLRGISTGGDRTIFAEPNLPFHHWAINYGPVGVQPVYS
jgi:hypothetical protein